MDSALNPIPENRIGSKEWEDTRRVFEKTVLNYTGNPSDIREKNAPAGWWYKNGEHNALFKGFLSGMAFARSIVNQSL